MLRCCNVCDLIWLIIPADPRSSCQIVNLRLCRFAGIAAAGFDGEAEAAADVEGVDTGAAAAGGEAAAAAGAADPCTACLCGGTDPGNGISANPAFHENRIMRHKIKIYIKIRAVHNNPCMFSPT